MFFYICRYSNYVMKTLLFIIATISILGFTSLGSTKKRQAKFNSSSIHQFKMNDINNEPFDFSDFKGRIILLVNVASKCGFTSQYTGLQNLYNRYESQGLIVIGVPSNDFGNQEPGTAEEIKSFCKMTYNVSFPILEKSVTNGNQAADLFQFLTDKTLHPKTGGRITWNFNKFLIDQDGHVVNRYSSFTKPESRNLTKDIESLLSQKGEKNE